MNRKEVLRKKMRQLLNRQTKLERRIKSKAIQKKLFSQKEFLTSKCVMLYVSKGTAEVEAGPIIKKALSMGKKVVLPVTLVREKNLRPVCFTGFKQGMKKSLYGIYEPRESKPGKSFNAKKVDLIIVPGVAFDKKNNRLGRGKGYYDSFLKRIPKDTPKIGLGFRFQVLDKIPTTARDIPLTAVITN
ncbi:MAG: 5-formyltetrahydrofolate cyclo-ligase [Candidatus Gorgyraea atricola]|nr:5-formyltetrahydrofolate cyclo-ligase [Candidatus Gorgyraea atricola]